MIRNLVMRTVMLAVASAVITIPSALAQSPLFQGTDDPPNDVELQNSFGQVPAGSGWRDVDLLRLSIGNETKGGVEVAIKVASWEADTPRPVARQLQVGMTIGGQAYQLDFLFSPCRDSAALRLVDAVTSTLRHEACVPVRIDPLEGRISAAIGKSLLKDLQGLPARAGTSVEALHGMSRQALTTSAITPDAPTWTAAVDRVPDHGYADPFRFLISDALVGDIALTSPAPLRFSNGESTTMAFEVHIENLGDSARNILLHTDDVPEQWTARVPPRVAVPARDSVVVPVILTTSFAHSHGETATFNVIAGDQESGEAAALELGIHFVEIPQPAGHHNMLHLHSTPADAPIGPGLPGGLWSAWANTLADDPDALDAALPPTELSQIPDVDGRTMHRWHFPLSPGLLIGLDADVSKPGRSVIAMTSGLPDPAAQTEIRLLYCDPPDASGNYPGSFGCTRGSWTAWSTASETLSVSGAEEFQIDLLLPMQPDADLVPFAVGSNLMVEVTMKTLQAATFNDAATTPRIRVADSHVFLPLLEYLPPVEASLQSIGSLRLEAKSPAEKALNPGKSTSFAFNLVNVAPESQTVDLLVQGFNADWARWLRSTVTLAPGERAEVLLAVEAPQDAGHGDVAELFAIAENRDDPAIVAMARLRAAVTTAQVIPDEEVGFEGQAEAPGPGFLMILVTMLAVAAVGRFEATLRRP